MKLTLYFLTLLLTCVLAGVVKKGQSLNDCSTSNSILSEKCKEEKNDRKMHPEFKDKHLGLTKSEAELTSEYWMEMAKSHVSDQTKRELNKNKAKNIVFFLGDGMGVGTVTAARMLLGGEEQKLSFEKFPYTGSSMTYSINEKVSDSACTATAYLTGVKGNVGTIGVNAKVKRYDCEAGLDVSTHTDSLAKWALDAGKAAGLVTTTRVTHASPAGVYAHSANRDWEDDLSVGDRCDANIVDDIAEQLVYGDVGSRLNVILGGGRRHFHTNTVMDEEGNYGRRRDGKDLIDDWLHDGKSNKKFIRNRDELLNINPIDTDYVLGLFHTTHMLYHLESIAMNTVDKHPTLAEMTKTAIEILSKNENGFFLFVEGGKIDLAHHDTAARASLDETIEFHKAIALAKEMLSESDTLFVVTADHSHAFSISGYPYRSNDIFGLTGSTASDGKKFFTLGYGNGPRFSTHVVQGVGRIDPTTLNSTNWNFPFPATVPISSETHGGEDVGVFAAGPWAHLFTGTYEQNSIPHFVAYAACIGPGLKSCNTL